MKPTYWKTKGFKSGGAVAVIAMLCAPPYAAAQSSEEWKALQQEVQALKAGQKDMQKDLKTVKDILMGKQPPLEDVYVSLKDAFSQGAADAKVTLVEFSDFQCPYCGRYASETYSQIIDQYVKTGKIRYAVRNFPLSQIHPLAASAAEAAECAGAQGKYWEMHDRLFKNQQNLDGKELLGHAVVLGLDQAKFEQCMDTGEFKEKVQSDVADGTKLNVRGTPTFFFGFPDENDPTRIKAVKLLSGAQPLNAFTTILDELLKPEPAGEE